jgi:hypothetical protein
MSRAKEIERKIQAALPLTSAYHDTIIPGMNGMMSRIKGDCFQVGIISIDMVKKRKWSGSSFGLSLIFPALINNIQVLICFLIILFCRPCRL